MPITDLKTALTVMLPLVAKKTTHAHYKHVVELATRYYRPLATGKDADHLLQRFNKREDEEAFKQRKRLTQLITPAICNTLMVPPRKIPKVRPVVDTARFNAGEEGEGRTVAESAKDKEQKLGEAASKFHAGKGVDHYLGSVLLDQGAIDPNAFCLVLYNDFDQRYDRPQPYPSIVSSADAWNFQYLNGELEWLLVHRKWDYEVKVPGATPGRTPRNAKPSDEKKKQMKSGDAWWLYTSMHHVMMLPVEKSKVAPQVEGVVFDSKGNGVDGASVELEKRDAYWYRPSKDELYEVVFYEAKAGKVQAFRLGYVPDQTTKGETMVSIWHPAMPYLMKVVKAGSELDLSASLHAFLQKISYENPCRGWKSPEGVLYECNDGYQAGGDSKCKACNGTGYEVHTSGQDHITMRMPRSKDEAFDLSSITHYVDLPVEVLTWQDGYVDKLEKAAYRAVYNSDRFQSANSATTTATGDIIDLQAVYDTLYPCSQWYSRSRVLIYELLASFVVGSDSLKSLEVAHEFPRNMRFETMSERVALMKSLREAGASNGALAQVDDMILDDLYVDDPHARRRASVMASFDPFLGKSEATIVTLISQDLCTKETKVFWTNQAYVYAEAEARMEENGLNFWEMARKKQRELLDDIVQEIVDAIDEAAEASAVDARNSLGLASGEGEGDPEPKPGDPPPSPGSAATGGAE